MNQRFAYIACAVLALAGCSSTKPFNNTMESPRFTPISEQTLNTSFVGKGIKVEWSCMFPTGITNFTCVQTKIKAIEAVGYAPAAGNSEFQVQMARDIAYDNALVTLQSFIEQDIQSTRVTRTFSKNIEAAHDKIRQGIEGAPVNMSDSEAEKNNFAVRENHNNTVREMTTTVRNNVQGIIRGAYVSSWGMDRRTVKVVVRWEHNTAKNLEDIRKYFGKK